METGHDDTESADQSNKQTVATDEYCWVCHKKSKQLSCSKCFRLYHHECIENLKTSNVGEYYKNIVVHQDESSDFICPVCKLLQEKTKDSCMDRQMISCLLKYLMETILCDEKFKALKHLNTNTMTNVMDLNEIKQKIDSQLYDSLKGFLVDIQCIKHHYVTRDQSSPMLDTVRELMKYCESELKNIISCAECYENKHTKSGWRSLPCSKPHLILWVKLDDKIVTPDSLPKEDIPCWPAKLLSVDDSAVNVIFFGHSEFVEIPIENCFIYSTEREFENAMKEVDLYQQNIRQKFGRFEDQLKSIPFNPNRLDEHMRDIFPDYYNLLNEYRETKAYKRSNSNDTKSNNFESEAGVEASGYDEDEIPNKRQRLSEENDGKPVSNPIPSSSTDSFNAHESNSNRNCEPPENQSNTNIRRKLRQPMGRLQNITNITTNLENKHMVTIQALRKELEDLKKSYDDSQLRNVELLDRLNAVTGERDQANLNAKNEVAKLKEEHAKGMTALDELRNQEAADAKTKLEKVRQDALDLLNRTQKQYKMELDSEKQRVSAATEKYVVEHEKVIKLEQNNTKFVNDTKAKMEQLENEKRDLRTRLQETLNQKSIDLESEKQRSTAEIKQLKEEHANELAVWKKALKNMEQSKQYLQNQFDNSHKSMKEFEKKLEKNHKIELNEIRDQHRIELETAQRLAFDKMKETMKMEYNEKVTALENQLKNAVDNNKKYIEQKCKQIVKNIKAEVEKCKGCGEAKTILFCSPLCEGVWTSLNK